MEWDDLLTRCGPSSFFQTFEWHSAWWAAFGHKHRLLLLTARSGNRLLGIAPLMVAAPGTLRAKITFIGGQNGDYQNFLIASDLRGAVLDRFVSALLQLGLPWGVLELRNLPESADHIHQLSRAAKTAALYPIVRRTRCFTLLVKGCETAVKAILNKPSVRRPLNRLRRQGAVSWRVLSTADEALAYLPLFVAQHVDRWRQTDSPSRLLEPEYREFFAELIQRLLPRGWLHFSVLELDAEPIAFHFGFLYQGRLYWYKPSFSPEHARFSPGSLLIRFLIEHALTIGLTELDFTIGEEHFKERFTSGVRTNVDVVLYRSRLPYLATRVHRALRATARAWLFGGQARATSHGELAPRVLP